MKQANNDRLSCCPVVSAVLNPILNILSNRLATLIPCGALPPTIIEMCAIEIVSVHE
jgi:hypothetical protein